MTPKEKAKQLVKKYKYYLDIVLNNSGNKEQAKVYALIAIDEVLSIPYLLKSETWFYNEVKKEIEKL